MSAAWIAVIASLGGVALGGLLNVLADTLRWRREDRQTAVARASEREERTQQLCIDLMTLADELISRLFNFEDFQNENPDGWRTDPFVQDQLDKLEGTWSSFNRTYNALRIAGMAPSRPMAGVARIRGAADALYDFISAAFASAYSPEAEYPEGDWAQIANRFLDEVAAELGPVKPRRQVTQPRRHVTPRRQVTQPSRLRPEMARPARLRPQRKSDS